MVGRRKYFQKIFLLIASVIIISTVGLTAIVYYNVEQRVFDNEMEANEKLLKQIEYNINLIHRNAQNICSSVYYNSEVRSVMMLSGPERYEHMQAVRMLYSTIVQTNSLIKSIDIYNNRNRIYYSTGSIFRREDALLAEYVENAAAVPVLRPIMRKENVFKVGDTDMSTDVLSYFMYEMSDHEGRMDGAIIVNISLDWLFDNMRIISMTGQRENDALYILSDNEEFIVSSYTGMADDENLKHDLLAFYNNEKDGILSEVENNAIMSRVSLKGESYLLTAIKIQEANWVVLRLQSYSSVFAYMTQLRMAILLISALAIILTCLAAFIVSKTLYKPIEGLLQYVATGKAPNKGSTDAADEFSYLASAYNRIAAELQGFRSNEQSNRTILKSYFIKSLLIESGTVTDAEFAQAKEEHGFLLAADARFVVCVIKLDDFVKLKDNEDASFRNAQRAAITNIFGEMLSAKYAAEVVDIAHDEITSVMVLTEDDSDSVDDIRELYLKVINVIKKELGLSMTVSISRIKRGFKEITLIYNEAYGNICYRIIYDHGSVFTASQINVSQNGHIDFSAEEALIEYIRSGDLRSAQQKLGMVFKQIRKLTYTDIQFSLSHLTHSIENIVYELNCNRTAPFDISPFLPVGGMPESWTLTEIQESFSALIDNILNTQAVPNTKKQTMTADIIREYVEKNHFDYNLSASVIADMLKLSPGAISKLFKEEMGMSVPEYINDVRLKNAVQWMKNSNLNMMEIMKKVGIENESYFYKIFKAKYGTSPRAFQRLL